ncbi:MAG: ABC transporter ATP-binding protein [Thermogutta sp.]
MIAETTKAGPTDDQSPADRVLVDVEQLTVAFGRQVVLRGINLRIRRGETLAILGESGCGKTVLLKTLVALQRPTNGRVLFDGQNLFQLRPFELAKQRIRMGFVFQQAALFDSMTIGENLAFPLRQHTQLSETEIQEIILARLQEVGLSENVLRKKPGEISGGMRKRVGLARALVLEPELMLYDEPTTGLDPIMSDVINELILRTRQEHPVTSVIVTHDMRTATKVADRIVMLYPLSRLKPGEPQIIYDGPAAEIEAATDDRVIQFVRGEARERLMELSREEGSNRIEMGGAAHG